MLTKDCKKILKDVYELDVDTLSEEELELITKTIVKNNRKKIDLIETKINICDKEENKEV